MSVKPKKIEKNIYSIKGGEYLFKNFFKETLLIVILLFYYIISKNSFPL